MVIMKMSHLWPREWFGLSLAATAVLQNVALVWANVGYDNLQEGDYVRLEPFLEPYDAVYNQDDVCILSRLGSNGTQKQYCQMYRNENGVWTLEWFVDDHRRSHLEQVAHLLYGGDATQSMVRLTHALASLRTLCIVIRGDELHGFFDTSMEDIMDQSLEGADIDE